MVPSLVNTGAWATAARVQEQGRKGKVSEKLEKGLKTSLISLADCAFTPAEGNVEDPCQDPCQDFFGDANIWRSPPA